MLDFLTSPLQYAFMQRGMLAAVIVGVVCAVLGTYVVLRGMAFFGDALAHAILPGVAVGYLVGGGDRGPVFWWAMATALVSAFGIGAVSRSARIKEDTAIGIIFAGMFALGIALISMVQNYTADLTHFLFGDVLGVSSRDLLLTAVFGFFILLAVGVGIQFFGSGNQRVHIKGIIWPLFSDSSHWIERGLNELGKSCIAFSKPFSRFTHLS